MKAIIANAKTADAALKMWKMRKISRMLCGGLCFLSFFFSTSALFAGELFEVTVKARGADKDEALSSAVDEAIRRSLGSLFAERSQASSQPLGDMLEEKLIQFSRGTATNYKILESSTDDSGVTLTVLVTVDSAKLEENARTLKEGTGSAGVERWESPNLEAGQKALAAFLKKLRYENFLEVKLEEKKIDVRKGLLNVTVALDFDRKRYASDFAEPLTKTLDKIFVSSSLGREIEGEFEKPADRLAASFHVLGENFSFRGWMLPRNFHDTMKREARFWDAGKGKIQTHKRIWLHFSLLDAKGKEIERVPIHLRASNVLFFSEERKESVNPWFFTKMEEAGTKSAPALIVAPRFGTISGGEYVFFERYAQPFAFRLPEELLRRIGDVKVALELER
ncbi:MAG: hypothetical protein LBQ42_13835 [Synergistaceae bacterium]|jgi:hypothetical protein|nr:hypothetical protein [Synergistaceae bacterium]